MNEFKRASVHELTSIIRLVDTKILSGDNLDFIHDWTIDGTYENDQYDAGIIVFFLEGLEDM